MATHNCMKCGAEMFWAYDEVVEESEEFSAMTVLTCPDCSSILQFYFTTEEKKMTQVERVLDYLQAGKKLTCLNAFNELGITQVAARIYELKEAGHNVLSRRIKVTNRYNEKCSVSEYYMENSDVG